MSDCSSAVDGSKECSNVHLLARASKWNCNVTHSPLRSAWAMPSINLMGTIPERKDLMPLMNKHVTQTIHVRSYLPPPVSR